jgi:DNA primase
MAGRIRREDIAEVREKARIEEIVAEHVSLRSAGVGSMKGLCPFHDERTPSFHVRPQVGLWHCFGCDEGGDVISFIQKVDHLTFAEAVEHLAGRVGVQLRYEEGGPRPGEEPGKRQRLLEAHRVAAAYFAEQLHAPQAAPARAFLSERGFDRAAAETFGVGFAPDGWDHLLRHLRGKSFTEAELTASGLVSQGGRGIYDRFRGRLVWPIRDVTGDVVGFGARKLLESDQGPKYLNTPETPIYRKSQVLYGIDLAKRAIASKRQVVVVEGYTDVMAAHLAGVTTAVATCGTAFGADHIRIVRRLLGDSADAAAGVQLAGGGSRGGEVVFTFDGDEAGQKAALRAFGEDQRFASQTFVAVEPNGLDPCELRQRKGDDAVRALIAGKEPLFAFAIRASLAQTDLNTAEGRVAGLRVGAPVVARIRDHALRGEYARMLSGWLGMDERTVRQAVSSAASRAGDGGPGLRDGDRSGDGGPRLDGGGRGAGEHGQRDGRRAPSGGAAGSRQDPVSRLERQVLEVVLQLPDEARAGGFDELPVDVFTAPAHRAVHDAIRAAGGVRGAGDTDRWAATVREAAAEAVVPLVTELAVAPLPEDRPAALGAYARGVLGALVEMGVTRKIADARSLLQRTDPADPAYAEIFAELIRQEQQRRALRPDG